MNTRNTLTAALVLAAGLTGTAHAALQGRDLDGNAATFEAYYDTVLDVTWLADANYAMTSGYDADGLMNWSEAITWAANLSFTDGVRVYDNWRLPTVNPVNGTSLNYNVSYNGSTDYGYNVSEQGTAYAGSTSSEMAHLFYNTLDNKGYTTPSSVYPSYTVQVGWGLTNTGPFTHLQADYYWSATENAPYSGGAWGFYFSNGAQAANIKDDSFNALAVSSGDVAAVPEAQTYALMLAGLGLIGWRARRRG